MATPAECLTSRPFYFALGAVLLFGIFLRLPDHLFRDPHAPLHTLARVHPAPMFAGVGFDEGLYRKYVEQLTRVGLAGYPLMVEQYIEYQKQLNGAILPPLRFLFIFSGYIWHLLSGSDVLGSLHDVASLFGILTLLAATAFAWRARGLPFALGAAALLGCAPMLIHMSQHALVDGFFTFWTVVVLWSFWENLRAPRDWRWLLVYVFTLCCLVLTKENAFFAFIGIISLILCNRWLALGTVTRELLGATFLGPLLGAAVLICLAGGLTNTIVVYRDLVSQAGHLQYAILTGDGPWYRYIVDLALVSPLVLILALGAVFQLDRGKKLELFCALFIAASYLVMCNVRYGMNLRYANMWEMPLRFLALSGLGTLVSRVPKHRALLLAGAVGLVCALELRNYVTLASDYPLYELVTDQLMRALHILKTR